MGFLRDLFSGIDDVGHTASAGLDDLGRLDFSGFEDRSVEQMTRDVMENDALRTVGLPIADYFSFGLVSPAVRAKYNKMQTGKSGFQFGDLAKSVAGNYLGNELFPATGASSLSDIGYNVAAGAGRGAVSSGVQGNSMTEGAKAGAIGGGLVSGGSYLGNLFSSPQEGYQPRSYGQGLYNETTQQSSAPQQERADYFRPEGYEAPQQSKGSAYVASGSPSAYNSTKTTGPDETSGGLPQQFSDFINTLLPSSPSRFGDTAQGLLGMYSGYRRSRAAKELRNQIGGNRGAYEQQLRANLRARDAASGRRSNYAGREVELQSSLAQLDSRNAPALAQLNDARYGGLDQMFRSGLSMGSNLGWFGSSRPDPGLQFNKAPIQPLPNMPQIPIMEPSQSLGTLGAPPRRWNSGGY